MKCSMGLAWRCSWPWCPRAHVGGPTRRDLGSGHTADAIGQHCAIGSGVAQLERVRVAPVTDATLPVDEFDVRQGRTHSQRLARLALPYPGRVRDGQCHARRSRPRRPGAAHGQTPDISELQSAWRRRRPTSSSARRAGKAEADVSRVRDLLANRAIAQKEVLVVETELAVATAALEQARATRDDVTRRLRLFGVNAEQREALASCDRQSAAKSSTSPLRPANIAATRPRQRSPSRTSPRLDCRVGA